MSKMVVLYDPGHGEGNGNSSPDGTVVEWVYARQLVAYIVSALRGEGIDAHILVPETWDISLSERVRRVNAWCRNVGKDNVALVSVHLNAAGVGKTWRDASGWLCFIDPSAGDASKRLAGYLSEEAIGRGLKGNRRQGPVVTKYLTMTHKTICAAVLTENMFQDNRKDVELLLSDTGMKKLVELHVEAIKRYCFS